MDYIGKYVLLLNWTDQGIKDVKDTIKRAESLKSYDAIVTAELPSDEIAMSVSLGTGALGNVLVTLLRHLVWMKREE